MKVRIFALLLLGALAAGTAAAQDTKPAPLPEAPSTVKQQQPTPPALNGQRRLGTLPV